MSFYTMKKRVQSGSFGRKKKGLKTLLPRSFSRVLEVYTLKYLSKSGNEDINFYYIGCHPLSDKTRDFPRSS